MKKPEMILFDYGHTLAYEPDIDFLRGEREVFKHISRNPGKVSAAEAFQLGAKLFRKMEKCREAGFEIHEYQLLRLKYDQLGIRLNVNFGEAERILWDGASPGAAMPFAEMMLDYLDASGIRKGVVSNIAWSGRTLYDRINRLFPPKADGSENDLTREEAAPPKSEAAESRFEFVIASSEYGVRKPDRMLFDIALKKAKLPAESVWYIGDRIEPDIFGAHNVGMFPVLYDEKNIENPYAADNDISKIDFDFMYLRDWRELIMILERAT